MNNLTVKKVPFMGDELMAAKDEKAGKIYAGVKWICGGIGLTVGQMQNERNRIHKDVVLAKGERNIVLPTKGGNQSVQCIDNDFVPLWLAKISITPTMQKEHPEVANKLVQYQLKAQKVLANAFLHTTKQSYQKSNRNMPLSSFNHLLEINIRQMKAASEPATHIAAWTNGITRDVLAPYGINVPALPDSMPRTYDATEIAKKLGVYSKSGKPHPQPVTAIIKEIGLAPIFTTETTAHRGTKDVPDIRYSESALEKVDEWLNEHDKPNSIELGGRHFSVSYQKRSN